jgi:hypothetical protein
MKVIAHRLATWSLLLSLAGASLTLVHSPAYGLDLDGLSLEQLDQYLDDELDDIGQSYDLNEYVPIQELLREIMIALSDAGDDEDEQVIRLYDLNQEMIEAGAGSLQNVVWAALQEADLQASEQRPLGGVFVRVARDTITQRGLGVRFSKQRIEQYSMGFR